ncbi:MAG: FTR1 family protein, partial [Nitrospinota bacterium]
MFGGLLITFREGLEAFLVIGIILSYLNRSNLQKYNKWVYIGSFLGLVSAFLTGILFQIYFDGFEGQVGELYLKIGIMGCAVAVLTYMVVWMGNNSRGLKNGLEANIKKAVSAGAIFPLVLMGFLAILREGFETVLFLGAVYGSEMNGNVFYGGLVGLLAAFLVTFSLFKGLKKMPVRAFFRLTGWLIIVIAAGLLNNMVGVMQDLRLIPAFIPHVFDISWIMVDSSNVGIFFKALLGYTHSPSLLQVLFYFGYLAV